MVKVRFTVGLERRGGRGSGDFRVLTKGKLTILLVLLYGSKLTPRVESLAQKLENMCGAANDRCHGPFCTRSVGLIDVFSFGSQMFFDTIGVMSGAAHSVRKKTICNEVLNILNFFSKNKSYRRRRQ